MGELNFSKIQLKDYGLTKKCEGEKAPFRKEYKGTLKETLFYQYVQNVKQMIKKTNRDKGLLINLSSEYLRQNFLKSLQ